MKHTTSYIGTLLALLLCSTASNADTKNISFDNKDWQVVCDNTLTCRAVGYIKGEYPEDDSHNISVLLIRHAGNDALIGKVRIPEIDVDEKEVNTPLPDKLELWINGISYDWITLDKEEGTGKLTDKQIMAIVSNPQEHKKIEFKAKNYSIALSDEGMRSILIKMDEAQHRVDTASAVVKKGKKTSPTKTYSTPLLQDAPIIGKPEQSIKTDSVEGKRILALLNQSHIKMDDDYSDESQCDSITADTDPKFFPTEINVIPLNKESKLIMTSCWQAAYNDGLGAWVMNDQLTKIEQFVSNRFTGLQGNQLIGAQKGRGIGDCFSGITFTWNGKKFIKTYEYDTGFCRGFPGGTWQLPSYKMDVASQPNEVEFKGED
ncbi:MAG: DUF1176 domain-containing protein [Cardiobacteriaceae bacterium]|nr:DUF1176 domain-containing protein [Cardiobacteriaceae bacterium]